MDQVIDAALLLHAGDVQETEEPPASLPPVSLDERVASKRSHGRRRATLPSQDGEDAENTPEQDFIIPPDQLPGENYPPAHAGDQPSH